jgi:hypothetical protein
MMMCCANVILSQHLPSFDFAVQGINLFLDHPTGVIDDQSLSAVPSVIEPSSSFGKTHTSSFTSQMQAAPLPNPWLQIFSNAKPAGQLPSPLDYSNHCNPHGKMTVAKKIATFKAAHLKAIVPVRTRKHRPLVPMLANTLFHHAIPTYVPLSTEELPHQIPAWCGMPLSHCCHDSLVNTTEAVPSIWYEALLDPGCNDFVWHLVTNKHYSYMVNDIRCILNITILTSILITPAVLLNPSSIVRMSCLCVRRSSPHLTMWQ